MVKKKAIWHSVIVSIVLVLGSCSNNKYPGFSKAHNDIYYQLTEFGEDSAKIQAGDYVTVEIAYKTISDSSFFSGERKFQVIAPEYPGSLDDCLTIIGKGEKARFILKAAEFFSKTIKSDLPSFFKPTDDMMVEVKVLDVQSERDYLKEKEAFLSWIEDFSEFEKTILRQFINEKKIGVTPSGTGMYYIKLTEGNNRTVALGDTVIVDYEGKFLNGKFFDSTLDRKEPFSFVYGQEWQVIDGMQEAIGRMHEGEKALIILPSQLAFGNEGSSTGIIPPYTSIIYEVELKEIRSGKQN